MPPNSQYPTDLVTFTEKIVNRLCSNGKEGDLFRVGLLFNFEYISFIFLVFLLLILSK